jgi:hypothetical protein
MTILELLTPPKQYLPTTVSEYFALQLARRLSDEESASWYRGVAEKHPLAHVLGFYRQAIELGPISAKERFQVLLKQ